MLNLLIAIMGDQYDIVQESGHEQYLYGKAGIILEYEARMSRAQKQNPNLFPEWLQLLQAKTDDGEESKGELSMTGRVKNHVSLEARVLSDQVATVKAELAALEGKLEGKLAALEGKLEGKLDAIMKALEAK